MTTPTRVETRLLDNQIRETGISRPWGISLCSEKLLEHAKTNCEFHDHFISVSMYLAQSNNLGHSPDRIGIGNNGF